MRMSRHPTCSVRKVEIAIVRTHIIAVGVVAALALGLFLTPAAARAEEKTREQQIADLEKQIQDLTKKLSELKSQPPTPPPDAPPQPALPADWVKALTWRCIGPAAMGGRIVAISVFEADPTSYWVATASGGLLKTTNNGVTFEHQFDREGALKSRPRPNSCGKAGRPRYRKWGILGKPCRAQPAQAEACATWTL